MIDYDSKKIIIFYDFMSFFDLYYQFFNVDCTEIIEKEAFLQQLAID